MLDHRIGERLGPRPNNRLDWVRRNRYFMMGVFAVIVVYGGFLLVKRIWLSKPPLPIVERLQFERFVLANGLEVILHSDSSAPIVALSLSYRVGSRDEPPDKTGLAHLVEHIVLAGTARADSEHGATSERLGAWDRNGATDRDQTRFYVTLPKQSLKAAIWIEAERMAQLDKGLTQEVLDESRQAVLSELRRNSAEAGADFDTALTEAGFSTGHPYAHLPGGAPQDIASFSLSDVRDWIKKHYIPNAATLVVAGELDASTVRSEIEKYFGSIPGGTRFEQRVTFMTRPEERRWYPTAALSPGAVAFVWVAPGYGADDIDRLDLARQILEARLKRSLVYENPVAISVLVELKPYQLCSLFVVKVASIAGDAQSELISGVEEQVSRLAREAPDSREVTQAARAILTSLLFTSQRVGGASGKAQILASGAVLAGNSGEFNRALDRISDATPEEISAAAKAWLRLEAVTVMTNGSKQSEKVETDPASKMPTTMPPVDPWGNLPRLDPLRARLPNGLTVLVGDRRGPVAAVKLVWSKPPNLPLRDELVAKAVFRLLSDPGPALSATLERLSARLVLDDTLGYFGIGLELPARNLDQAIETLSAMVVGTEFQESRLEAARQNWEKRLARPEPVSWKSCLATLLRLISFNQLGNTPEPGCRDLASFSPTSIRDAYMTSFSPNLATLIIIGNTASSAFEAKAARLFGCWSGARNAERDRGGEPVAPALAEGRINIVDRPSSDYAVVLAGFVIPPDTELEAAGGDAIVAFLDTRINDSLRAETPTPYEVFAGHLTWKQGTMVYAYVDAATEAVPGAIRVLEAALREVDKRKILSDLKAVITQTTINHLKASESAGSLMENLVTSAAETADYPLTRPGGRNSNKPGRTTKLSTAWLVLGDSARLTPQLRRLGYDPAVITKPCWCSLY